MLHLLFFARYADLLGRNALDLPLPASRTVAGVIEAVRRLPGGEALPAHVVVAVNARQAASDAPVSAGDEVAFLPPMAGG